MAKNRTRGFTTFFTTSLHSFTTVVISLPFLTDTKDMALDTHLKRVSKVRLGTSSYLELKFKHIFLQNEPTSKKIKHCGSKLCEKGKIIFFLCI